MKLYGFFRSSAAFRVRIALNLKGLSYEQAPVHLRRNEQFRADYRAVQPQALVPALALDDGEVLIQSLAIIEYLEETQPRPPLLPGHPAARARVRALALAVACDIHPINNLRVLRYVADPLGQDAKGVETWYNHWIKLGFDSIERILAEDGQAGDFCQGDEPSLADVCLVPQFFNAQRYPSFDLAPYPTIRRIAGNCLKLDAFQRALPENQPDAE
ncbi:MAG TPA: maleylacetoacetate isomerase [Stellaceae bacterium]|nr:maleylacetoacetate isomerase [Stellaceae bacterium]